jgi:uncharacterized Zn finger protein (UPF0148 family)
MSEANKFSRNCPGCKAPLDICSDGVWWCNTCEVVAMSKTELAIFVAAYEFGFEAARAALSQGLKRGLREIKEAQP